jgi:hypothetical protein
MVYDGVSDAPALAGATTAHLDQTYKFQLP